MSPHKTLKMLLGQRRAPAAFRSIVNQSAGTSSLLVTTSGQKRLTPATVVHSFRADRTRFSPRKTAPTQRNTREAQDQDEGGEDEGQKKGKKPRKRQTMSQFLRDFVERFETIAGRVLASEGHPLVLQPCPCGHGTRTTRCKDCSAFSPVCDRCYVHSHHHNPFHFPEKWNGSYFERTSQAALGRIVCMGHGGDRCPSLSPNAKPLLLDVVDLNGVHGCEVLYCKCPDRKSKYEQILELDLFPGTARRPATAFTFAVLKHFDLLSSISKTSALDFVTTLSRSTNNAFPDEVPEFYTTFRRVVRVWRSVQIRKRAGEFHGMQTLTGESSEFYLALKCPACPQPGFNMPWDWRVEVSDTDKHKYTLFLSLDGNFKQQLKIKNCDADDIELFIAFFSRKETFEAYLKTVKTNVEKSTCANLKANNLQSQLKFLSMIISGVVSCKCARHDMYRPGATVDLKKGESFAYTDYALRQALRGFEDYPFLDVSYDIACQYCKHVADRFDKHFNECKPAVMRCVFHVPKLHGQGHSDECRYEFSFDFAEHVGRTHGERIEGGWSEGNLAATSTREMNPGHRHEALSAFYNEWNYQQTIKLPTFLANKLLEARRQIQVKNAHFAELTETMGEERLNSWRKLSTSPVFEGGEIVSVYRVKERRLPSMDAIERRLSHEISNVPVASAHDAPAQFVACGLRLEARQRALKDKASSDDAMLQRVVAEIQTERMKLRSDITIWRDDQVLYMPGILELATEAPLVENDPLCLPSSVPLARRSSSWFTRLAGFEKDLRKGQADDALSGLRLALKYKDSLNRDKRRIVYGNRNHTRSQVLLRRVADLVHSRAESYRHARKALIALGMSRKDPCYPALRKDDITLKVIYGNKALGEGRFTGSWIWAKGPRGVLSDAEEDQWEEEGNRVEWFRARIDLQQWREEYEILGEELNRTAAWFTKMCSLWRTLGEQASASGHSEYAYQKADMFARRAQETLVKHSEALAAKVDEPQPSDSTFK